MIDFQLNRPCVISFDVVIWTTKLIFNMSTISWENGSKLIIFPVTPLAHVMCDIGLTGGRGCCPTVSIYFDNRLTFAQVGAC